MPGESGSGRNKAGTGGRKAAIKEILAEIADRGKRVAEPDKRRHDIGESGDALTTGWTEERESPRKRTRDMGEESERDPEEGHRITGS